MLVVLGCSYHAYIKSAHLADTSLLTKYDATSLPTPHRETPEQPDSSHYPKIRMRHNTLAAFAQIRPKPADGTVNLASPLAD